MEKYLKKDGILVASIPNICNYGVVKRLIFKKDFKYTEAGILDQTHLRFFCKKNIYDLFTTDFQLLELRENIQKPRRWQVIKYFLYMIDRNLFVFQYLVKAKNVASNNIV